jgi:uncharacterized membrane protein HdeD (DUF308 family)
MAAVLSKYWWLVALRGLAAVVFGVLALVWPGLTLNVLIYLLAAYLLVDGIFSIVAAFRERGGRDRWWVDLLEGLLGVLAGLAIIVLPGLTALVLLYILAAWAVLTGILEIVTAIQLRRELQGEFFMILSGIASIAFGVLIALFPGDGLLAVVWIIGIYAILFGILLIVLAFRLRGYREQAGAPA